MTRQTLLRFSMSGVALAVALGAINPRAARSPTSAAPVATITVNAASSLGSTSNISNFMAMQGEPSTFDRFSPNPKGIAAWKALGLNLSDTSMFDDTGTWGTVVTRNQGGGSDLDFTAFDATVAYHRNTLLVDEEYYNVSFMPRAIAYAPSSPDFWKMSPASPAEWYDIVFRTVLHIKNDLGDVGASYQVWSEPSSDQLFIGKNRPALDPAVLDDYIELYVTTWFAVKTADPAATVAGPGAWDCTQGPWVPSIAPFGTEDFIAALADYNNTFPNDQVTMDEVVWQDYNWSLNRGGDGSMTDCADHVRGLLQLNGFPAATPQMLGGWNAAFNDNPVPCRSQSRKWYAAHDAYNIIEQVAPEGKGGVARAYFWPFDYDGGCKGSGLIHKQGQGYLKRQAYAAFQALHDMEGGAYTSTTQSAGSPLMAMSAREGTQRCIAIVVNYSKLGPKTPQTATVTFNNLPAGWTTAAYTLKRIGSTYSAGGNGLEAGVTRQVTVSGGSVTINLTLPADSIRQIILQPVGPG